MILKHQDVKHDDYETLCKELIVFPIKISIKIEKRFLEKRKRNDTPHSFILQAKNGYFINGRSLLLNAKKKKGIYHTMNLK